MSEYSILVNGVVTPAESIREWGRWFEDIDNRRVAFTKLDHAEVSTVFLGIDHGWGGAAQWFETMVFGGALDQEMDRYATLEEAMQGHERMVARAKEAGK